LSMVWEVIVIHCQWSEGDCNSLSMVGEVIVIHCQWSGR